MKRGKYVLIIILIFVFLFLAAVFSFIYLEFGRPPAVKARSYLEIKLSGEIQEQAPLTFGRVCLDKLPLCRCTISG